MQSFHRIILKISSKIFLYSLKISFHFLWNFSNISSKFPAIFSKLFHNFSKCFQKLRRNLLSKIFLTFLYVLPKISLFRFRISLKLTLNFRENIFPSYFFKISFQFFFNFPNIFSKFFWSFLKFLQSSKFLQNVTKFVEFSLVLFQGFLTIFFWKFSFRNYPISPHLFQKKLRLSRKNILRVLFLRFPFISGIRLLIYIIREGFILLTSKNSYFKPVYFKFKFGKFSFLPTGPLGAVGPGARTPIHFCPRPARGTSFF